MTLKALRKKYCGKCVDISSLEERTWDIDKDNRELFGEYIVTTYYGDEDTFFICIELDENRCIKTISSLKCKRLVSDEATHVNYRGRRIDEYDYDYLDTNILCGLVKI